MPQLPQLGKERVTRLQSAVLDWFAVNQRDMPWRRTRDPYLVLLSEVMLQQTQVARVLPKYLEFVERFPTVRHLAGAPLAEVIRAWSPLGYNLRAVRLHRAAQLIVERHGGVVPREPAELRAIPGLGEYSAAAVACFAYEEPVGVVDTNVRRVLTRVFPDAASGGPAAVLSVAQRLVPAERARSWGLAIMDLGATVCTTRKPACLICPLAAACPSATTAVSKTRLSEARPSYGKKQKGFFGSNRYYRGRVVESLRRAASRSLALSELGPTVRPGFGACDLLWLRTLVHELARDGLVSLREPPTADDPAGTRVSLAGSPSTPDEV